MRVLLGIPRVLRQQLRPGGGQFRRTDPAGRHARARMRRSGTAAALDEDDRPDWLSDTVDATAQQIQVNINRAADVNPINLLALALLSTPKHAMGEADLLAQIALSKTLLAEVPYRPRVTVTPHTPEQIVAHGEEIRMLTRIAASAGRRAERGRRDRGAAELLPQQRAAPVHRVGVDRLLLPAQPAHVAQRGAAARARDVSVPQGRVVPAVGRRRIRPSASIAPSTCSSAKACLQQVGEDDGGILGRNAGQSDEMFRLRAIGHALQQAFERYYIAISVLAKNGPGTLGTGNWKACASSPRSA